MNEQEARDGAQYGEWVGWRHQTHCSGAWPWAMIPAGLPSSQPPPWSDSPDLTEATKAARGGVGERLLKRKPLPCSGWPEDRWAERRMVTREA